MHETTGFNKQPERMGRISELAVRLTRERSDQVFTQLIPELVPHLVNGELTVPQLMTINEAYFKNKAAVVGSLGSRAFFARDVKNIFDAKLPKTETGLRSIGVNKGDVLVHPDSDNLDIMAETLVNKLNEFVATCETRSDEELRAIIMKFYLLFSILHLPTDGSGRFTGDVDTLIQSAVSAKLEQHGRPFPVCPISATGYRMGHYEEWGQDFQHEFTNRLLELVIHSMVKDAEKRGETDEDGLYNSYNDGFEFSTIRGYDKMQAQRLFKKLNEESSFSSHYLSALNRICHGFILDVLNTDDNWFNQLATRATQSRSFDQSETHYATSDELGESATKTLDTIVGLVRDKHPDAYRALSDILGSPAVCNEQLVSKPEIADLLLRVMDKIKTFYTEMGILPTSTNPVLADLEERSQQQEQHLF